MQQAGDFEAIQKTLMKYKPVIEETYQVKLSRDYPADRLQDYTSVGGVPHLDDQYTVFGQVIDGLDVIDKIAAVTTDSRDRPVEDVKVDVEVELMKKKKISKEYGYNFEADENNSAAFRFHEIN
jgi:peptidyl-prolyl cis-trans isomerase B (cyclophilin B)